MRYIDAQPQRPRLCVEVLRNGPTRNAGSRMSPARNRQAPCFHLIILIKKNIYGRLLADPAYFVCRRPFPAELHKAHPRQWMRGTETSAGRPMGGPDTGERYCMRTTGRKGERTSGRTMDQRGTGGQRRQINGDRSAGPVPYDPARPAFPAYPAPPSAPASAGNQKPRCFP